MKKYTFLDLAVVNAPYEKAMTEAVGRVITSGRYIGGAEVESFEEALAAADCPRIYGAWQAETRG